MTLRKAPVWTDLYYDVVKHYFWRPQDIGRKRNPSKPSRPWDDWRKKLQSQETPLNHILDFLFHIAPQELLDQVISALLQRRISNLQLVEPSSDTIDSNIVQPDIILSNNDCLVFVEMKVDSQSSIDQFAKYAIAACSIRKDEPQTEFVDLVLLSRHADHSLVWRNSSKLGLSNAKAVRDLAIRGLEGNKGVWKERGVPRYMKNFPDDVPLLREQVRSMGLHLADYSMLLRALQNYAAQEKTVSRLIDGVVEEFRRRNLLNQEGVI